MPPAISHATIFLPRMATVECWVRGRGVGVVAGGRGWGGWGVKGGEGSRPTLLTRQCLHLPSYVANSKHWFTTYFLQPLAVFSYTIGSRKLSANEQFFVGAQTVVGLIEKTRIISDVCFITEHVATPAQIKPRRTRDRKVARSSPGRNGGKMLFSGITLISVSVPPCVTSPQ